MSDQAISILKDSGLPDEEGKKNNVRDPLTSIQSRSGRFLSLHKYMPDLSTAQFTTSNKNGKINIFD